MATCVAEPLLLARRTAFEHFMNFRDFASIMNKFVQNLLRKLK